MRTKFVILFLSFLLVLAIAGCSLIGMTWTSGSARQPDPTLIPLRAPLRRVMNPSLDLAVSEAGHPGFRSSLNFEPAAQSWF